MLDLIRNQSGSLLTKIIFGVIILVFVFWGVGNYGSAGRHTVATINGAAITVNDFYSLMLRHLEGNPDLAKQARANPETARAFKYQVLQNMSLSTAMEQEADRMGLFVSPAELLAVVRQIGLFQGPDGKFSKELYEQVLKAQKIVPGEFEADQKRQILVNKLRSYVMSSVSTGESEVRAYFDFSREERTARYVLFPAADFMAEAAPSDAEVEGYYATSKETFKIPAQSNFDFITLTPETLQSTYTVAEEEIQARYEASAEKFRLPKRFKLSQISLEAAGPEDSADETIKTANAAIVEQLNAIKTKAAQGDDFAALAREFSTDESTREEGGAVGWFDSGQILPEIETVLAGLQAGQLSAPIFVGSAYRLLRLDEVQEARLQPIDEVEKEIASALQAEKALADFANIQTRAEDALREGRPFAELAKSLQLSLQSTGLATLADAGRIMGLAEEAVGNLGYIPAGKAAPAPFEIRDGVVLVFVTEARPEIQPTLEDVREQIVARLAGQRALELARLAAEKALPEIAAAEMPEAFRTRVNTSGQFNRQVPVIEGIGTVPTLVEALFSSPAGKWLPGVHMTENGAVVAAVNSVVPASGAEWEAMQSMFTQALSRNKEEQALMAFMNDVISRAEIKEFPEVIDGIPLQ
jgi:Parvulin-like peptidyl-prolyl isomerase